MLGPGVGLYPTGWWLSGMSRFISTHGLQKLMPMHVLRKWFQEGKQKRQEESPPQQHVHQPMLLLFIGKLSVCHFQRSSQQIARRKTGTGTETAPLTDPALDSPKQEHSCSPAAQG